ncbi:MAG TPA: FIST C-terminal domain-containing protein [Rhodoferax sp.]|nr:FIST C-terminal domain-containing protein [Rhodoferax sp.]
MKLFPYGHATHPQWRMAAALVLAQLRAHMALPGYARTPTLGLLYITDHYASAAQEILEFLGAELPQVTDWSGTVGVGIASNNVEYFDEPALAVMLCDLPSDQYRVFSGVAPLGLGFDAHTALIHADSGAPDVGELVAEMAGRTATGYLFGGLASSRTQSVQFAVGGNGNIKGHGAASGVFSGGLSGVAFGEGVNLVSRVTQGCQPVAPVREITGVEGNVLTGLDDRPALDVLMDDLGVSLAQPRAALAKVRATLVGLSDSGSDSVSRTGHFGSDVIVRHIVGLDPARKGVAIAEVAEAGMRLAFCQRNAGAARADLIRICAEIREELEPEELPVSAATVLAAGEADAAPSAARRMAGAIYVSCSGRGGPHFGAPSAELQIVRRALGDVPLVGFFAGGEIARHHLYGYTGVLTVFGL